MFLKVIILDLLYFLILLQIQPAALIQIIYLILQVFKKICLFHCLFI